MLMEMNFQEISVTTNVTGKVFINTTMATNMKATGWITKNTASEF